VLRTGNQNYGGNDLIDHFAGSGLEENFKADFAKMLKKNTPKKLSKK
jgi:hypothetical protein